MIDISNWKFFKIGDLFTIDKPAPRVQTQYEPGVVPFVASGNDNNGIQKYCKPKEQETLDKGNCITVSPVDGYAFYQEKEFLGRGGAGSSINILRNDKLNKYNALYLCTLIRIVCSKYSYTQMCSSSKLKSEKIPLPVLDDGTPDWEFMENYIRNIEQKQIQNLTNLLNIYQ